MSVNTNVNMSVNRIEIVAQHGWGFSAQSWLNYLADFAVSTGFEISASCPDRGYFNARSIDSEKRNTEQRPAHLKVVIAHSLGLHLLPADAWRDCDLLVAVSSFANFHLIEGRRTRALVSRMLSKLDRQPLNVVRDFLHNSFQPAPAGMVLKTALNEADLNIETLRADLMLLNESCLDFGDSAGSGSALAQIPDILLLHGTSDGIVSGQHAELLGAQLPQSQIMFIEGQGHALPFTNPLACHLALRQAIRHASRRQQREYKVQFETLTGGSCKT